MGRLGFAPEELWTRFAQALDSSYLEIVGLMGHLPTSEEPGASEEGAARNHTSATQHEIERFRIVVEELETYFGRKFEKHLANSGAVLFHSSSHFDLARVGLALYGADPRGEDGKLRGLVPALSCESKTIQIRTARPGMTLGYGRKFEVTEPMTVGFAPIGYAEGIPRSASSKMEVLVQGKRCKVLGNVSMSLLAFDLSKISSPQVGDKVTIIGTQCDERIGVEDLARWAGVLPYEILTGIGRLVGRREIV
jgi:alanine racemase